MVEGVAALGLASGISAAVGWLVLLVVARAGGPEEYATFSAMWSLYLACVGVLVGLQQEQTRSMLRSDRGTGTSETTCQLAAVVPLCAVAVVPTLIAAMWWAREAGAAEQVRIVLGICLGVPFLFAATAVNARLAADARWRLLAAVTIGDQVVRLLVVAVVVHHEPGPTGYALAIAAGVLAYLPLMGEAGRALASRAAGSAAGLLKRASAAMVATGCANLLAVGMPFLISVTGESDPSIEGSLFAAIVLTRSPLLLPINALRPLLLRQCILHRDVLTAWFVEKLPAALAAGVAAVVGGALVGPAILKLLFGPNFEIAGQTLAGLVACALLMVAMTISGVALVALDQDASSTGGWAVAVIASLACLALPLDVVDRTLLALAAGPAMGLVVHLSAMARGVRSVGAD